jgi:CheY-like chemotaxis protein
VPGHPVANSHPTVLIVDRSADSREVLRTVLEKRGVQTWEASEPRRGAELAREHHPQVIVLDLDSGDAEQQEIRDQYQAESQDHDAYLVVIGRSVSYSQILPKDRILAKPYHYAPLVRTIEDLLNTVAVSSRSPQERESSDCSREHLGIPPASRMDSLKAG